MGARVQSLRDDFSDNSVAAAWDATALGSATVAETGGEARCTLPSSAGAGPHTARYTSHSTYDLTGGSIYANIDTMVSTAVAATAFFQLYKDGGVNALQWIQLSGTLSARTLINGVPTTVYSVAWNATTYKYLRISESGGNIQFDSSSNGTSWTNRAAPANPFVVTDLTVDFGATCANVASPGSFRLAAVNLILPALTTNWRSTRALWALVVRNKRTQIACDTAGGIQGYLLTADGMDVSGEPSGNIRYWSGPADGGRVLTEQTTQAAAEDMAVDLPVDGTFDLPTQVDARFFRLYHRSIDGTSNDLREFLPRRLVQSEDIEAESVRTINLAAGAVTADKIFVIDLEAVAILTGSLTISGVLSIGAAGGIYQGTGTFASPTTGLKIYNSAGIGKLSTYKAGVEQITIDTDGALKWAAGGGLLDADGLRIAVGTTSAYGYAQPLAITFEHTDGNVGRIFGTRVAAGQRTFAIQGDQGSSTDHVEIGIQVDATGGSAKEAIIRLDAQNSVGLASIIVQSLAATAITLSAATVLATGDTTISGGLNVGTATGAPDGVIIAQITDAVTAGVTNAFFLRHVSSGTPAANFGLATFWQMETSAHVMNSALQLNVTWATATNGSQKARANFFIHDTAARSALLLESNGSAAMIGFLGAAAVVRQTIAAAAPAGGVGTAAGGWSTAANRDAAITLINNMRTALINLGLCV